MARIRARGTGSIFKPKGNPYYWIAYMSGGKRRYEGTRSTSKKVAQDLLTSHLGDVQRGVPITPKIGKLTFEEAAKGVLDDFQANGKRSRNVVERRIRKHLRPYFGGRRMADISTADVVAYKAKRQADTIVTRKARVVEHDDGRREETPVITKPVSNGEINRELQILKRCFNLAIEQGLLLSKPTIKLFAEPAARSGFFEADQLASVLARLPEPIQPVIRFAAITGWRISSEVLPLEWRQVDFAAGEVRLDAGTTKNRDGRVFPMTAELRSLLEARQAEHEGLKREGRIVPYVFHRDGERIVSFLRAWHSACRATGYPGRIPHDLRRTAVRNLVRAGIPERVAMRMTGHKTRSVFERYNIVSDGDLRDAARKLDVAGAAAPPRAKRR